MKKINYLLITMLIFQITACRNKQAEEEKREQEAHRNFIGKAKLHEEGPYNIQDYTNSNKNKSKESK